MNQWKPFRQQETMSAFFKGQVHQGMNKIYSTDNDLKRHQKLKELERQKYYSSAIKKLQLEVVQLKKIHSKIKYQNTKLEGKQTRLRKEQDKIDQKKQQNA